MLLHNIKRKCEEQGLSLRQLSIMAGLEDSGIYKWDSSIPSVDRVAKVAEALGTTVDELLKE